MYTYSQKIQNTSDGVCDTTIMVCLKIKEIKSHLLANKLEDEGDKLEFLVAHETWLIKIKEVQDGLSYHT